MVLLLVLLFSCINGNLISLKDEYAHKRSLSQCLMRAVNCCLPFGETITVVMSNFETEWDIAVDFENILLEDLSNSNKVSYILKKINGNEIPPSYMKPVGAYIIRLSEDLDDLRRDLTILNMEEGFDPHAKFFMVATGTYANSKDALQYVADLIWNFRLVNVVGFLPEGSRMETYNVYIGHIDGKCGQYLKPEKIDECNNGKASKYWFIDKIPKNLNGCLLQVRTSMIEPFIIHQTKSTRPESNYKLTDGLEVKLLNTVADYINLTINYSMTQSADVYGKFYSNLTFSGSYLDLSNKKIDLIVGYVVSRPETQQIFDTITSYFQDSLVFCVSHARRLPNWIVVGNIFKNLPVIIYLLSYAVLSNLIYWSGQMQAMESVYYKTYVDIIMRVLRVLFGLTENILPRTSISRFLILLGIICSFFYRSAYTIYSMNSLSTAKWEYQVHTTREILTRTIQYYPLCPDYFAKNELAQMKSLKLCEDYTECLNRTVQSDEFATCMPKLNVQYLFRNFLDENGYPALYCFNKVIVTYPIEMLMWKGHPLKPRINKLVNRLSAGGFIYKWEKEIFNDLLLNSKVSNFVRSEEIVLTINHLSLPFTVVLICYFMTIVVFIGEIAVYRRKYGKVM